MPAFHLPCALGLCLLASGLFAACDTAEDPAPTLRAPDVEAALTEAGARVSWTSVPDADAYLLERQTGAGPFEEVRELAAPSFVDADALDGATYAYRVTPSAQREGAAVTGPSGLSNAVRATRWAHAPAPTLQRAGYTATPLPDGSVLVAGGTLASGAAERYDPASNAWFPAGALVNARRLHAACVLADGRVLVAGGEGSDGALRSSEVYDPAQGRWEVAARLPAGVVAPRLAPLGDGGALLVGGEVEGARTPRAFRFRTGPDRWEEAASLPQPFADVQAGRLPDGSVLVTGLRDVPDSELGGLSAFLYDPAADRWASTTMLPTVLRDHAAVPVEAGAVLAVSGGLDGETAVFTAATRRWTSAGRLPVPRRVRPVVAPRTSGSVLVLAGDPPTDALALDLYDPVLRRWARSVEAPFVPDGAVPLPGGGVFVLALEAARPQAALNAPVAEGAPSPRVADAARRR